MELSSLVRAPARCTPLLIVAVLASLAAGAGPASAASSVSAVTPDAPIAADGVLVARYESTTAAPATVTFDVCATATCTAGDVLSRGSIANVAPGTDVAWRVDPPLPPGGSYYWQATASTGEVTAGAHKVSVADGDRVLTGVARSASGALTAVGTGGIILHRALTTGPWTARPTSSAIGHDWLAVTTYNTAGLIAVGRAGAISRSVDEGETWTALPPCAPNGEHLLDVTQLGSARLYAVGSNGLACRSTDGGATWTAERVSPSPTPTPDLVAVAASPNRVFAVDAAGTVWSRTDAGSWSAQGAAGPTPTGIYVTSDTALTVVDAGGRLWSSVNAGATFTSTQSPLTGGGLAIDAATTGTLRTWIVGAGQPVYTDNGATFTPAPAPTGLAATWHDVEAFGTTGEQAVLVGSNRSVVTTSDSGASWTVAYAPPTATAHPTLSGSGALGSTLLGQPGSWTGHSLTFTTWWERCTGPSCSAVPGAASPSYTISGADANSTLQFVVTASNSAGTVTLRSPAVTAFTIAPPSPTTKVNHAPTLPTSLSPNSGMVLAVQPEYAATFVDPDGDRGVLEFERCGDAACTTILARRAIGPLASGAVGLWRPEKTLATGLTVFWRVRAVDAAGLPGPYTEAQSVSTPPVVLGTTVADSIAGSEGDDAIASGAGNDRIDGAAGDDVLDGGAGNDVLRGCAGDDHMTGGAGNDSLAGCEGDDRMDGGVGVDRMDAGAGDDAVAGGAGNDIVRAGDGNDVATGGAGNDIVVGGAGTDRIDAGLGNDTVDSRERSVQSRRVGFAASLSIVEAAINLARAKAPRAVRDRVTCGRGVDHVLADKADVIAADCEFVNGRRHKFR
ncbi:MAG: hypothetical protein JWM98_2345 [Thermoleophilia bacterium]|nr:hypothetical protein [Thermoleophilia bacterium]